MAKKRNLDDSALLFDRDGNVSVNFKNDEVNQAFKKHLEELEKALK